MNPELAGNVRAGQRYYAPEADTPENMALARAADAKYQSMLQARAALAQQQREAAGEYTREINRAQSISQRNALSAAGSSSYPGARVEVDLSAPQIDNPISLFNADMGTGNMTGQSVADPEGGKRFLNTIGRGVNAVVNTAAEPVAIAIDLLMVAGGSAYGAVEGSFPNIPMISFTGKAAQNGATTTEMLRRVWGQVFAQSLGSQSLGSGLVI